MELRFLRDTGKREIDFVVLKEGAPSWSMIGWRPMSQVYTPSAMW